MNIRSILKELRRKRKSTTEGKLIRAFRRGGWIQRRNYRSPRFGVRNVPEKGQVIKRSVDFYLGIPRSLPPTPDYYKIKVYDSKGNLVVYKAH